MKRSNHLAFVLITALGVSSMTISCDNRNQEPSDDLQEMQAERDAEDRMEEMRENIRVEREEFIVQARAQIDKNKRDIEDLRVVARSKKGEAKARYDAAIENLKEENDRLEARIDDNRESVDEKWDSFKEEFNHDMDKLGNSISDLFKDNK